MNHRDIFIRQHLYPGVAFGVPLFADGCGTVIATGSSELDNVWKGKRVILSPGSGWLQSKDGPDAGRYTVRGGTYPAPVGTLQEQIVVGEHEVVICPAHLTSVEAAALPLTGLTAWRALVTKSENAVPGRNILITGIGGGVALMALKFAVAFNMNVYVNALNEEQIRKAISLGAKGGVLFTSKTWPQELLSQLPENRKFLDTVIDGAADDIVGKTLKILKVSTPHFKLATGLSTDLTTYKHGGVIVSYGMTLRPNLNIPMSAVMRNIELRGTTSGSLKEFKEMVKFVDCHEIRPVVDVVTQGLHDLDSINRLFDGMKKGLRFGKSVVEITSPKPSKL